MKNLKTVLFLLLPFIALAQSAKQQPAGDVHLIKPIIESPAMSPTQAKAFARSQAFRNWGIEKLKIDSIMQKHTGKDVKICICDTGRPNHPDIPFESIGGSENFTNETTVGDLNGHATHVAGIVLEIAPGAKLYFARVLNTQGSGTNNQVAAGIRWCVDQKANIINLSLGSSAPSTAIKTEIDYALSKKVIVIAAAGNEGQSETQDRIGYPAKYEEVVSIGSINEQIKVSFFSSSGDNGDVVAPGEKILSTWKDGNYIVLSGTSMATPFISALAALYLEKYGNTHELEGILEKTTTDIAPLGYDRYAFWGYPNSTLFKDKPGDIPGDDPTEPLPDEPENPLAGQPLWLQILITVVFIGAFVLIVYLLRKRNQAEKAKAILKQILSEGNLSIEAKKEIEKLLGE